ncbi:DUF397 domain-containing protein [Actinomadura logoneensis]|uniref:DUF397 domain-containing protein n=1 Tax=Actinomadura logoneensis TaxID=2293572 RepID=A0A372JK40_9ACTN|nr:DUF397 domain-containing protein [Actinomadura logoneensis]RFU40289.1 DUF397 domain-containing protein [Actinomadura logoneensis]
MTPIWRKSSYSHGVENSDCVELASLSKGIGVRDSKAPKAGHLLLARAELALLLASVKRESGADSVA